MVVVCLDSHGTAKQFCGAVVPFYLPTSNSLLCCNNISKFYFGHSVRYVVISHYAFNLYIFNDVEHFSVFSFCLYILSGKMSH